MTAATAASSPQLFPRFQIKPLVSSIPSPFFILMPLALIVFILAVATLVLNFMTRSSGGM
jgi:hypothetical protein